MTTHLQRSFVVSTEPLAMAGARTHEIAGLMLTAFDDAVLDTATADGLLLSFETARRAARRDNTLSGSRDGLVVTGSPMNTEAIYYAAHRGRLAVWNDLFLAPRVLRALDLPVSYSLEHAAELTFFAHVHRLRAGETLRAVETSGGFALRVERGDNVLEASRARFTDLEESIAHLRTALERAVCEACTGVEGVHVSLSGGIDSGTIAALVRGRGAPITAYTLATDWANEAAQAGETAAHLGIPLERVHISTAEILAEAATVIRYFGFVQPDNIEIALVAHCLYKKLHARTPKHRRFVTGYGSDLLNAGGILACESMESLHAGILRELARTQHSNEFSSLAALQFDVEPRHPFWHRDVIDCALAVPPHHKLGAQDKLYLREAMRNDLPEATVRRTKLGAHHGTGLGRHLADAFGGAHAYRQWIHDTHRTIFERGMFSPTGAP